MASKSTVSSNPLITTATSTEAPLNVQLHPLVLLTVSDYITRHTLRRQEGPILGAIIGQQSGRKYTLEHAYQCKTNSGNASELLDGPWFNSRLEMYSQVHKDPALDLVAVFAIGPADGPQPEHLSLLQQVRSITSLEGVLLLLFHPELVDSAHGGKLPISLYESVEESAAEESQPRFRELTFEVETGDAEMIGVDFVAKGGGAATAVPKSETAAASNSKEGKGKGKAATEREPEKANSGDPSSYLSPEDDELLSLLTAKVNAIKMLNDRINLIRAYLCELPTSYLTDATSHSLPHDSTNFSLLRRFNSLVAQAALLAPPQSSDLSPTIGSVDPSIQALPSSVQVASEKERQDVHLTSLLASLTRSIAEAQSLGTKLGVVQRERTAKDRSQHSRLGLGAGRSGFTQDGLLSSGDTAY